MTTTNNYENFLPKELFYTQEEIVNQYGSSAKKSMAASLVLKDEGKFLEYKESDLIVVNAEENKTVSKKLIHDLLSNEGMYKYIQTNLDNELGIAARIDYVIDKDSIASIKLTRKEFIEALNQLSNELTQREQIRSAFIKSSWLLFSCEQRYRDYYHRTFTNNTYLDIPATDLLKLLSVSDEEFDKFIKGDISFGYAKEILAYALVDFVERERILIKYDLPENIINRYKNIKNYSLIDFESINKNRIKNDLNKNGESIIDKIEISSDLMTYLDSEINPVYSNLEKAVYYYIKLCEIFSLDENYYLAKSQSLLDEHESTESINSKNKQNNKVAMYDFLVLYASIIDKLNIYFTLGQDLMSGEDLGNSKLTFKYGEYLIAINSLAIPEKSDFTNIKINDQIMNMVSINKNKVTKKKFDELKQRIYREIREKKQSKKTFKEALNNYRKTMAHTEASIQDKIFILLKEITRSDLKGLDMVGYEKKIFNQLFGSDENISLSVLAKHNDLTNYLTPVSIVSIFDGYYHYIIVDETSEEVLRSVTIDELIALLSTGVYYYVENEKIPGISRYVGDKFVR